MASSMYLILSLMLSITTARATTPQNITANTQCNAIFNNASSFQTLPVLDNTDQPLPSFLSLSLYSPPGAPNQGRDFIETYLWLGINESIDPTSNDQPASACALIFNPLNISSNRGQLDNGSCYDALSKGCVTDLESQAESFAYNYAQHNSTKALNNGDMCVHLSDQMNAAQPPSCQVLAQNAYPLFRIEGVALTGSQTPIYKSCTFNSPSPSLRGQNFYPLYNYSTLTSGNLTSGNRNAYEQAIRTITPVMIVWTPGAKPNMSDNLAGVVSNMTCLRPAELTGNGMSPNAAIPLSVTPGSTLGQIGLALSFVGVMAFLLG